SLDQLFLSDLGPHVAAVRNAVVPYDRKCDMALYPGSRVRGEDVAVRSLEELKHRLVLPRRRVRHIDDDVRPGERLGQPIAGDGVEPRRWGGRHGLVAPHAQERDQFLANKPGPANYYDLHVGSP